MERLRKELASMKEEREELVELRDFVYNQEQVDVEVNESTLKEAVNYLNNKKVIVCGGRPSMITNLKEYLPKLEHLSTDTLGKNFNYLRNYDVVYYYPNYASHSFYEKVKPAIANSKTKFVYLPDKSNVQQILMEMYTNLGAKTLVSREN